jgi:hypothetical protein
MLFLLSGLAISTTTMACASSSDDTSSDGSDSSTHADVSSGDSSADASGDGHDAADARDATITDSGAGGDTSIDDTALDDTLPASDSFSFDSSFDVPGFDTSFDFGFDFGGFDTGGGGDGAALCTGVTCPPGEDCCPYAGSPFAGRCYSKACLACCTPTP